MKYLMCALFNDDTQEFSAPFLEKSKKLAIGRFEDKVIDALKDNRKSVDPNDWKLFCIADYDTDSGNVGALKLDILRTGKDVVSERDSSEDADESV